MNQNQPSDLAQVAKETAGLATDRNDPSLAAVMIGHDARMAQRKHEQAVKAERRKARKALKVARRRAAKKAIHSGKCIIENTDRQASS